MKKFLFSVLAVGALAACTKSEVKYEGETEIAFRPVASVATKANVMHAIDGTVYPEDETFKVWGYWQLVDAESDYTAFNNATTYINERVFALAEDKGDGKSLWRGTNQKYYWPKTGSMVFACVSPAEVEVFKHDVTKDQFIITYNSPLNSAQTELDLENTIDLMWTNTTKSYNEKTAVPGVPVTFNHALSWITFKVQGDDVTSNGGFVINSLTMNAVKSKGTFVSNPIEWQGVQAEVEVPVYKGNENLTTTPAILENVEQGTLVIPQVNNSKNYVATIEFTNTLGDVDINEVVTIDLGKGWEAGKHYTYYIKFTATEILIEPHVEDWVEVDPAGEYEF